MRRTVVELDLVKSEERCRRIDEEIGADALPLIAKRIDKFVREALKPGASTRAILEAIQEVRGDHALLVFKNAEKAHHFAEKFHRVCAAHNGGSHFPTSHYSFRLGIATGELASRNRFDGLPIIGAVRLEGGGKPGHILIDPETYELLPPDCRLCYGEEDTIVVKEKPYRCHWYEVIGVAATQRGIVPPAAIRSNPPRLTDEVFAVELLRRPVLLERNASGHTKLTIDRDGVEEMVISNEAKRAVVNRYVDSIDKSRELLAKDREIQAFLAGRKPGRLEVDPERLGIRLRWASGGVLSIIHFSDDSSQKPWVPLFFRDIRPHGWNISLGQTERWLTSKDHPRKGYSLDHDLNSPWDFMLREFLEETLVLDGSPHVGARRSQRPFDFGDAMPWPVAMAGQFSEEHRRLRRHEDGTDREHR